MIAAVRAHFGCQTAIGAQLENHEANQLIVSKLESTMFKGEILSSMESKETGKLSSITVAWLKDTGWYTDINMEMTQEFSHGAGKGCTFYTNANPCDTEPEFCNSNPDAISCTLDGTSPGVCEIATNSPTIDSSCRIRAPSSQQICNREENVIYTDPAYTGEAYSANSKCFVSDLIDSTQTSFKDTRCYNTECSTDGSVLMVSVGSSVLNCTVANQGQALPAPNGFTGTLNCPASIAAYCQVAKPCTNNCNNNGVCVNGKCFCTDGYRGLYCPILCDDYVYQDTCVPSCPAKTFVDRNDECTDCHEWCSECNGTLVSQCLACEDNYYLDGTTCAVSCPDGTFANDQNNKCDPCLSPCENCVETESKCLSCVQEAPNTHIFYHSVNHSCLESCPDSFYGDANNICLACVSKCATCEEREDKCLTCRSDLYYFQDNCYE